MERYGSVAKECSNYFMTNGHAVKKVAGVVRVVDVNNERNMHVTVSCMT